VTQIVTPRRRPSARRVAYRLGRRGRAGFPPTLAERAGQVAGGGTRAHLAEALARRRYAALLASYVWFDEVLEGLDLHGARLVWDTHDVHAMRLAESLDPAARRLFDMKAERARERAALRRGDAVLAISNRDLDVFRGEYGIETASNPAVGYLGGGLSMREAGAARPLVFGFLGSGMDANRLALELLLDAWWPAIHRFSPGSRLLVAGRIARDRAVADRIFLRDEIEPLGRVEDLRRAFYDRIDVLLSPVAIPGGLNIKMVEALLQRRIVITNAMGARALRPLELATTVTAEGGAGGDEAVALLGRIEDREPDLMRRIDADLAAAARLFGGQEDELDRIRAIFSGAPPRPRLPPGPAGADGEGPDGRGRDGDGRGGDDGGGDGRGGAGRGGDGPEEPGSPADSHVPAAPGEPGGGRAGAPGGGDPVR
jgi:hypothetical protein